MTTPNNRVNPIELAICVFAVLVAIACYWSFIASQLPAPELQPWHCVNQDPCFMRDIRDTV
jgi:uncharacterized membrane protein YqjE